MYYNELCRMNMKLFINCVVGFEYALFTMLFYKNLSNCYGMYSSQLEIQNKLKTITNVVDMLNGIIGEEAAEAHESDGSPDRKRKSRLASLQFYEFHLIYMKYTVHFSPKTVTSNLYNICYMLF